MKSYHNRQMAYTTILAFALFCLKPQNSMASDIQEQIVGLGLFKGSHREKTQLLDKGFLLSNESENSLHNFYCFLEPCDEVGVVAKEQRVLSPLITTDTILEAFIAVEEDSCSRLWTAQKKLMILWHREVWNGFLSYYKPEHAKDDPEALRLASLIAVGCGVLVPEWKPDAWAEELPDWVWQEVGRINQAKGKAFSNAWGRIIDYSEFEIKGLDDGNPSIAAFHKAKKWWSGFTLNSQKDYELILELRRMIRIGGAQKDHHTLKSQFMVLSGASSYESLESVELVLDASDKRPERHVRVFPPEGRFSDSVPRAVDDANNVRPFLADSMFVMSLLGRKDVERVLLKSEQGRRGDEVRLLMESSRAVLSRENTSIKLPWLRLRVLEALANPVLSKTCPAFMHSEPYRVKLLQTALAGWVDMQNDTKTAESELESSILSGNNALPPAGFVEPNMAFWDRMLDLVVQTQIAYRKCGIEDERWDELCDLIIRCRLIAQSYLEGKECTENDLRFFMQFGDRLARIHGFPYANTKGNHAAVRCIRLRGDNGGPLYGGTGIPQAVYAVFPYQGRMWLCKGGVVPYRECRTTESTQMDESKWRRSIGEIPVPTWLGQAGSMSTNDD